MSGSRGLRQHGEHRHRNEPTRHFRFAPVPAARAPRHDAPPEGWRAPRLTAIFFCPRQPLAGPEPGDVSDKCGNDPARGREQPWRHCEPDRRNDHRGRTGEPPAPVAKQHEQRTVERRNERQYRPVTGALTTVCHQIVFIRPCAPLPLAWIQPHCLRQMCPVEIKRGVTPLDSCYPLLCLPVRFATVTRLLLTTCPAFSFAILAPHAKGGLRPLVVRPLHGFAPYHRSACSPTLLTSLNPTPVSQ